MKYVIQNEWTLILGCSPSTNVSKAKIVWKKFKLRAIYQMIRRTVAEAIKCSLRTGEGNQVIRGWIGGEGANKARIGGQICGEDDTGSEGEKRLSWEQRSAYNRPGGAGEGREVVICRRGAGASH